MPSLWWESDPEAGAAVPHVAYAEGAALSALWWGERRMAGEGRKRGTRGVGGCLGPTTSLELNSRREGLPSGTLACPHRQFLVMG